MGYELSKDMGYRSRRGRVDDRSRESLLGAVQVTEEDGAEVNVMAKLGLSERDYFSSQCLAYEDLASSPFDLAVGAYAAD